MARVDYDRQAGRYDRGRAMTDDGMAVWMATARRHFGDVGRVLDLGSGTGRFSAALADALDADIVGVEPSAGMREQALGKPHPRVTVLAGTAEAIPLDDASVGGAWLSNVIHHFDDLALAARELRRVVSPEGSVVIRTALAGKVVPTLYRFFPTTQTFIDSFPALTDVIDVFEKAGFGSFVDESVTFKLADNLAEMIPRTRMRADTALEKISDEEFESGLGLMAQAASMEPGPVVDHLDVVVIR